MRISPARSSAAAFSLVEVLVVVAVIGVIAGIAIMNVSGVVRNAEDARDRRNAQSLASTTNAAQAAGLDFVDPDLDLDRTIDNVVQGGFTSISYIKDTFFGVPSLSEEAQEGAARYLELTPGGQLLYTGHNND